MKTLLVSSMLALCLLPSPMWSMQPYRVIHRPVRTEVVEAPVVVEQVRDHRVRRVVRAVVIETVAQINPAYLSVYSPEGYDSATQSQILQELQKIAARLDTQDRQSLASILSKLAERPQYQQPMPRAEEILVPSQPGKPGLIKINGLMVLQQKCSACHQAGRLSPNQRFTLLDGKGNLALLTPAQKFQILRKTYLREMPPEINTHGIDAITDPQYASIVELLQ